MLRLRQSDSASGVASLAIVGVVAVAAFSLEAALAPGVLIGAAAFLASRQFSRLRRKMKKKPVAPAVPAREVVAEASGDTFAGLALGRSAFKTITFRALSSGLDFGWNYFLLGEVATAAGLSAISLGAAPVFYFLHETVWNRYRQMAGADGSQIASRPPGEAAPPISQALAKTITFRTFATLAEFGTNYAVVRDVALAANLSAFGFVAGPFVYLAHEKAWDRYWPQQEDDSSQSSAKPMALAPPAGA
jgi:uncharacterized membrane protein